MRWCCGAGRRATTSTALVPEPTEVPILECHHPQLGEAAGLLPPPPVSSDKLLDSNSKSQERHICTSTGEKGSGRSLKTSLPDLLFKKRKGKRTFAGAMSNDMTRQPLAKGPSLQEGKGGGNGTSLTATTLQGTPGGRKGVLKSSLKLLTLRAPHSPKGVQYADEVFSGRGEQQQLRTTEENSQQQGRAMRVYHYYEADMATVEQSSPCSCCPPPASPEEDRSRVQQPQPSCPHHPAPLEIHYGPMLLAACKSVLYVSKASSDTDQLGDIAFLNSLTSNGWTLSVTSGEKAIEDASILKPIVILLNYQLDNIESLERRLRAAVGPDEALIAMLKDNSVDAEAEAASIDHIFSNSSRNIRLCEAFSHLLSRLRAAPALFAIIEEADQPVKICDERNVVQYVNKAYEAISGQQRSELLGHCSTSIDMRGITGPTSAAFLESTAGVVTPGEKENLPTTSLMTTSCPNTGYTGRADNSHQHYHGIRRRSSDWHCIAVSNVPSPQFVYVKRGSGDGSSITRDLSLKSLRSQNDRSISDTPITEALGRLNAILHRVHDEDTQQELKDAIRILSSTELYSPYALNKLKLDSGDKSSPGYYDGLIRLHHPSRQRKRSIVDAFREHQHRRVSTGSVHSHIPDRRRISTDLANLLENAHEWSFDVLELERITEHHPLVHLGMRLFDKWSVAETLKCSADTLGRWFSLVEANYRSENAYHNATHAADVLQATSYFLDSESVGQHVQDLHAVSALVAATVHDLDHPGRGNAFLVNVRHKLSLLYNDRSVLENHHVGLAFQLTLSQPGANILAKLTRDEFGQIRRATVEMVLATDMSRHFEYLSLFQQFLSALSEESEENKGPGYADANSITVCSMMIKCADIANPCREWRLCYQWAMRIVQEYFDQTEEEKEKGLPVTMKGFCRETCNIPTTQCTFVEMFARETFTMWSEFAEMPRLIAQVESNYKEWQRLLDGWDPAENNVMPSAGGRVGPTTHRR